MRYLAHITYDGSHFMGFQRLKNGKGVQNELERVLSIVAKKQVQVKGAGRTDIGVHALDQCIHFDFDQTISLEKLQYILNRMLSPYISIVSLEYVDDNFHARFSVKEKTYVYKIYLGEKNPFYQDYYYCMSQKLDKKLMKIAAKKFLGKHNFHNFVSGERDNYESIISKIKIYEQDHFAFEIKGKSFYRYMVRSIVGALVQVGLKK